MSKVLGHAPVTLALTIGVVTKTLLANGAADAFSLSKVLAGDYANLVTPVLAYDDKIQLAVGSVLLHMLRVFEQQFGSRKFGSFVFFSWLLSVLLHVAVSAACQSAGIAAAQPASGPFFLIFALLVLYYYNIPALSPSKFSLMGLGLSEKTWTYVLGLQLACSAQAHGLVSAGVGLLVGLIYYSNQLGVQGWRLPGVVEKLISLPLVLLGGEADASGGAASPRTAARSDDEDNMDPLPSARQRSWSEATQERLHDFGGLGEAIQPPTEEQIATITSLGFDRARAVHALEQCDNNVEQAANFILR